MSASEAMKVMEDHARSTSHIQNFIPSATQDAPTPGDNKGTDPKSDLPTAALMKRYCEAGEPCIKVLWASMGNEVMEMTGPSIFFLGGLSLQAFSEIYIMCSQLCYRKGHGSS